ATDRADVSMRRVSNRVPYFFFQAEDGIRDWSVTGVQTCALPILMASGKPAVLRVSWDRRTSSPGCSGTGHLVRPGEYQVSAVAGPLHSRTVNFVLGAKGVAGP